MNEFKWKCKWNINGAFSPHFEQFKDHIFFSKYMNLYNGDKIFKYSNRFSKCWKGEVVKNANSNSISDILNFVQCTGALTTSCKQK